jgi:hypothetical protein
MSLDHGVHTEAMRNEEHTYMALIQSKTMAFESPTTSMRCFNALLPPPRPLVGRWGDIGRGVGGVRGVVSAVVAGVVVARFSLSEAASSRREACQGGMGTGTIAIRWA